MNAPTPPLAPWLDIPQATHQPRQQNPSDDIEQQALGPSASNPNPDPALRNDNIPTGQNSVRTRVFSGLLMLAVVAFIVVVLIATSVHHVKAGKIHRGKGH